MNEPCYYRVSVKGIVIDETGRFLLSKEENGKWEILGGGLEHNEDPIDCLKREIMEETGLVVTYVSETPKYFISVPREGYDTYIANVIYEIKVKDLNFTPSDECVELRFFSIAEARKEKIFHNTAKLLDVFNPALHI